MGQRQINDSAEKISKCVLPPDGKSHTAIRVENYNPPVIQRVITSTTTKSRKTTKCIMDAGVWLNLAMIHGERMQLHYDQ